MSRRMRMMVSNGMVTVEVHRPNMQPYPMQLSCRVTPDKIYTVTRAFCRNTLQQLSGIAGDTPYKLISYTLND